MDEEDEFCWSCGAHGEWLNAPGPCPACGRHAPNEDDDADHWAAEVRDAAQ